MSYFYFKAPKRDIDMGAGVIAYDSTVTTVNGVRVLNYGFNTAETEALIMLIHPDASKLTDVRALASIVELTESQYDTEKPNFPK